MNALFIAAYRTYTSLEATYPQLTDTFSLPEWYATEYHAAYAKRVTEHERALKSAQARMRVLHALSVATGYAREDIYCVGPDFDELLACVRGYDPFVDF